MIDFKEINHDCESLSKYWVRWKRVVLKYDSFCICFVFVNMFHKIEEVGNVRFIEKDFFLKNFDCFF